MNHRTYLADFKVILPRYQRAQDYAFGWLAAAHARAEATANGANGHSPMEQEWLTRMERLVRRYGCSPTSIGKRYSELEDFLHQDWSRMQIFNLHESAEGRGLDARNQYFAEMANRALGDFFADETDAPADLLHVTCTGYASPSAIQRLLDAKEWHTQTRATQVYHMGCYAAVPALRVARGLLLNPQSDNGHLPQTGRAEIVHTELCTLHFNPRDHRPEQLVVQSLFADGHIRYALTLQEAPPPAGFEVLAVREEVVPNTLADMTWVPSEWGFRMTLAREVPEKIAAALPGYLQRLFVQAGECYETARDRACFAVHPGGPRIIDSVQTLLGLREDQVAISRALLFEHGNMSSATLPHVWGRMLQTPEIKPGTLVGSLAFGPGLTIAGALFRKL
ncbi:MAG: naringenin-chalcone synthase [Acidobacteria bacterium]|nr:naringenin-chalcone synthase [Acidobacteriota bacterium]MBI3422445.1 naringenin-chalcone synthase [Acidobacteriota bacterium]